jgi:hypothetical protein
MSGNLRPLEESEPAGLNSQLTIPAHPRHDLLAVTFVLSMTFWWSRLSRR